MFSLKKFLLLFLILGMSSNPVFALTDDFYKELDTLTRIIKTLDDEYVEPLNEHELILGAIRGMLMALDPYTIYMPADTYKDFKSDTSGKFGGVGIEITAKDGVLTVVAPIEDTPADKAGIKAGDRVIAIDGIPTKQMSLMDSVHRMRGNKGSKVVLSIYREGFSKPHDFVIVRDIIKVVSVKKELLKNNVGYVRIVSFQEKTAQELNQALNELTTENKKTLSGIVLDVRNNPGGLLTEAVKVCDLFLADGAIVSTKGRNQDEEIKLAKKNSPYEKIPMVVMIDSGSASASEIVAGALQDRGRARLVGTKSFGKGSVQTVIDMSDKAALKITIAKYYTPKGRSIDGKGIVPDRIVDEDMYKKVYPKKEPEKLSEKVEEDKKETVADGRPTFLDFQKQKAVELLR